ncbi:MAG: 50S ribosomal protein L9 [Candidatus Shikimatogenerans sp. JK-2022]|nr:50S ribosomal protein L9 [Candidatus Shikimatogenerans bostrichidophilus]
MIKIILKKKIDNLGNKYDVVDVKSGYALNYLIPNKYAIIATKSELKKNNELLKQKKYKIKILIKKYKKYIKLIKNININFYIKKKYKNNTSKIFGSITKKDIKQKLEKYKIFIKKKNIYIKNKIIKNPGKYKIKIKLFNNLETYLNITILDSNLSKNI